MENSRKTRLRERTQGDAEVLDPVPMEIPAMMCQPTLREEMQRYIRAEFARLSEDNEHESFEEADDFEEDDPDPDFTSPYELQDMQDDAINGEYLETVEGPEPEAQQALEIPDPEVTPSEPARDA